MSATVCVRRLNSTKAQNSGTPIQKLKRENMVNRPTFGLGANTNARTFSQVNFTGYNPAFRPQYFNPNAPMNGGFSSAMSVHSGATSGWGPNQNPVTQNSSGPPSLPRTGPVTSKTHSLSSGYGSHMPPAHMGMPYPNQNRALPPPPYAKVQY